MTETKATTPAHTEEWFQIQYSRIGADDWNAFRDTYDTLDSAIKHVPTMQDGFENRIVRTVLTETVVVSNNP